MSLARGTGTAEHHGVHGPLQHFHRACMLVPVSTKSPISIRANHIPYKVAYLY